MTFFEIVFPWSLQRVHSCSPEPGEKALTEQTTLLQSSPAGFPLGPCWPEDCPVPSGIWPYRWVLLGVLDFCPAQPCTLWPSWQTLSQMMPSESLEEVHGGEGNSILHRQTLGICELCQLFLLTTKRSSDFKTSTLHHHHWHLSWEQILFIVYYSIKQMCDPDQFLFRTLGRIVQHEKMTSRWIYIFHWCYKRYSYFMNLEEKIFPCSLWQLGNWKEPGWAFFCIFPRFPFINKYTCEYKYIYIYVNHTEVIKGKLFACIQLHEGLLKKYQSLFLPYN